MSEALRHVPDGASYPARKCWVVTPHNSNALPDVTKALRAGGAGTITFRPAGSSADVAHPVLEGEILNVRATHVRSTGTNVSVIAYA